MTEDQIKHMVNRFLAWKLPEDFIPDGGISFKREFNENTPHPMKHEPSGTNLLDAAQAEAMIRYLLDGLPSPQPNVLPIELDGVSRALENQDGFWRSCSGCHELDEGVPTGPYSMVMKCHLGMGCSECGGIGAIWDTTDYEEMGRFLAADAVAATEGSAE